MEYAVSLRDFGYDTSTRKRALQDILITYIARTRLNLYRTDAASHMSTSEEMGEPLGVCHFKLLEVQLSTIVLESNILVEHKNVESCLRRSLDMTSHR